MIKKRILISKAILCTNDLKKVSLHLSKAHEIDLYSYILFFFLVSLLSVFLYYLPRPLLEY